MIDRDALLRRPVMAVLGRPAVYTPPDGGTPVPCTVRLRSGDRDVRFREVGLGVTAAACVATVRAAEVPLMEEEGMLAIGEKTYRIIHAVQPPEDRSLWRLDLE
ncbi:hypothetical protein GAY33_05230 [Azospirillum brasilense]|uniref:head-tail joining protein n=1 Tax=Azospirillum argentinense TaxID=2970906 RepID=UPI00190DACED|nr:hypothetical protein [Azospirillum argentinense]MBK3798639.1 hypothetical protein [Azospirillum argentinense]